MAAADRERPGRDRRTDTTSAAAPSTNGGLPGGTREISYEITEHDAPHKSSFRGFNGPIRPLGTVTVEPLDGGQRSKLTLELELTGHGPGVLLAPLARANARKEIPKSHQRLKRSSSGHANSSPRDPRAPHADSIYRHAEVVICIPSRASVGAAPDLSHHSLALC